MPMSRTGKGVYARPQLNSVVGVGLDFGHSGINPLQTRQERGGAVWKLNQVWWEGGHHEITLPPMPLPSSPQLAAIFLLPGWDENGQSRVRKTAPNARSPERV